MNPTLTCCLAAVMVSCTLVLPAAAIIVGGGGGTASDCLVALDVDVNFPRSKPRRVRCIDGDPSCDADGLVNGVCELRVAICANSTFDSACTVSGVQSITVEHSKDNGDPKFDPDFQALQARIDGEIELPTAESDQCTAPIVMRVPVKGPLGKRDRCGAKSKKFKLTSVSQVIDGKIITDRDKLKLTCLPDSDRCDPRMLFDGTFDRIQKQVFNQNCALSGCHDSQTRAASLLLEVGAAHGNLISQVPDNEAAASAGWLRVNVVPGVSGEPETSFLYRKLSGDLPTPQYGDRMPRGKRKLHKTLREIIRLWIEVGAPETTWAPGTD